MFIRIHIHLLNGCIHTIFGIFLYAILHSYLIKKCVTSDIIHIYKEYNTQLSHLNFYY